MTKTLTDVTQNDLPCASVKVILAVLRSISMLSTSPPPDSRTDWKYIISAVLLVPSGKPETKIHELFILSFSRSKHVSL